MFFTACKKEKKWEFWCFTGEIYRFFTPGDLVFFMASRSKKDSSTSKNGASYLKNPKLANSIKKTSACSIVSQVRESDGIISNIHIYIYSYQLLLIVLSMQNRLDKDPWGPQSEGSWPWRILDHPLEIGAAHIDGAKPRRSFWITKNPWFFGEFPAFQHSQRAAQRTHGLYLYIYIYIVYCILYIVYLYIVYCILYVHIYIYTLCMGIVQSRAAVFHMEIIEVAIVSQAPLMFVFCGELDGSRWNFTRLSR